MTLSLLQDLNAISVIEATIVPNIEALMAGFGVSSNYVVEDATTALSNISIKVGSGHETTIDRDINTYTALRILATPINRNVVNVKPPLFKLIVQRAGSAPDVDNALQKLAGHPEFQQLRKEIADKFEKAAKDPEKSKELASEIDRLRIGYQRLATKLQTT